MKYLVHGVGNALVDIQTHVTEQRLAQFGYHRGAMTLVDEVAQQKVLLQLDQMQIHRSPGGSACNTIVGIADMGGRASLAAKVGDDELGRFYLEDLKTLGVGIDVAPRAGQTGTCVCLISDDAQRTMLTNLGVSALLGALDITEQQILDAQYVYVEGYLFTGESTRAAAIKAIDLAKQHGRRVSFTVSDPFLINLFRDEFWALIRNSIDLLFCNIEEARSLTGEQDPIACAQAIHRHCPNVALTLGKEGSIIMHEGTVIPIESVPTTPVDTTGAGDMYAAGLLFGVTNGWSWKHAGHLASHAASRIVGQMGARLKTPFKPEEIEAFKHYG